MILVAIQHAVKYAWPLIAHIKLTKKCHLNAIPSSLQQRHPMFTTSFLKHFNCYC